MLSVAIVPHVDTRAVGFVKMVVTVGLVYLLLLVSPSYHGFVV